MWTGGIWLDLATKVADVDPQDMHFTFVGNPPYLPEQLTWIRAKGLQGDVFLSEPDKEPP
jgi:hypothetical protein